MLRFALVNRSDRTVYIFRRYTPLEGLLGDIFRVARNGEALDYVGSVVRRRAPTREDYVAIEPGDSLSAEVEISQVYDFSKSGEYKVAFDSRIRDFSWQEESLPTNPDAHVPVDLSCNEITLVVE